MTERVKQWCVACGRALNRSGALGDQERAIGVGQTCACRVLVFSESRHLGTDLTDPKAEPANLGALQLYFTKSERSVMLIASLANDPHRPRALQYAARRLVEERLFRLAEEYVARFEDAAITIEERTGLLYLSPMTLGPIPIPHRYSHNVKAWEMTPSEHLNSNLWYWLRVNHPRRVLHLPHMHPHDRIQLIPNFDPRRSDQERPPWEI